MTTIGECLKVSTSKSCYHWVRTKYDEIPNLCSAFEIKGMLGKSGEINHKHYDHFKDILEESSDCGNPWNVITDPKEKQYVLSKKKQIQNDRTPIAFTQNSVIMTCDKHLSKEKTKEILTEYLTGDCWAVYTRDSNHKPIKVYFDSRKFLQCNMTPLLEEQKEMEANLRYKMYENIDGRLDDLLKDIKEYNLTLCLVMGCIQFIDVYIYGSEPSRYNNNFDIISNQYLLNSSENDDSNFEDFVLTKK